jgi:hypothetical protein
VRPIARQERKPSKQGRVRDYVRGIVPGCDEVQRVEKRAIGSDLDPAVAFGAKVQAHFCVGYNAFVVATLQELHALPQPVGVEKIITVEQGEVLGVDVGNAMIAGAGEIAKVDFMYGIEFGPEAGDLRARERVTTIDDRDDAAADAMAGSFFDGEHGTAQRRVDEVTLPVKKGQ